jgi:hypothetical protein
VQKISEDLILFSAMWSRSYLSTMEIGKTSKEHLIDKAKLSGQ